MKIKDATFITSVASKDKFYKTNKPIIAVAGKSNVGKSSLINMLANRKKLAKTLTYKYIKVKLRRKNVIITIFRIGRMNISNNLTISG